VVDLAVKAGANDLNDVQWNVADPVALQAKAGSAALAKAKAVADQMAKGLGSKLGELVYASNRAPVAKPYRGMETVEVFASLAPSLPPPTLTLFPKKVKSDATVYAVFSIEQCGKLVAVGQAAARKLPNYPITKLPNLLHIHHL